MTERRLANRRSPLAHPRMLCSGPGKLTLALGVTVADHGRDLCHEDGVGFREVPGVRDVHEDGRIGISRAQHLDWRFTLKGSNFLSARPQ